MKKKPVGVTRETPRGKHRACCQAAEEMSRTFLMQVRESHNVHQEGFCQRAITALGAMSNRRAAAAVRLKYLTLDPLDISEIADMLGLTEVQVSNACRRFRALEKSIDLMETRRRRSS